MSKIIFLKEAIMSAKQMGAIVPYSRSVGRLINNKLETKANSILVEIGPGTGAITATLVDKLSASRSFLLEINPNFVKHLRKKFPQLTVHHGSLENLNHYLEQENISKIDSVVCSIPWSYYNQEFHRRSLGLIRDHLGENGTFITVANLPSLLLKNGRAFRKELKQHFRNIKMSKMVWANFPPAFCYVCSN